MLFDLELFFGRREPEEFLEPDPVDFRPEFSDEFFWPEPGRRRRFPRLREAPGFFSEFSPAEPEGLPPVEPGSGESVKFGVPSKVGGGGDKLKAGGTGKADRQGVWNWRNLPLSPQ